MIHPLIALLGIFALCADRYRNFHYLAGGETLAKLQKAKAGFDLQQKLLAEVKERFKASDIRLASDTELNTGWPEMRVARGFKLYFGKGSQPKGWSIPENWGDRQRYWDTYVYLPGEGTEDQRFLTEAAERLHEIRKTYSQPKRGKDYSSGWYSWEDDVFPKNLASVYSKQVASDVHIITVRDLIEKKAPDYEPAGSVRISAADVKMLESDPDKASARAKYIQNGNFVMNAAAKISHKLGL